MAKPTTNRWTKLTFWLGDGGTPTEDFTQAVCGMITKSFSIEASVSNQNVPDCDDPDLASWVERVVQSLSAGWQGSGVMAEEVWDTYRNWMLSGASRNGYVVLDIQDAGYFSGAFVLTNLTLNGSQGDGKIGISCQVQSDGEIVWNTGLPA